ncbi:S-type pyocin domain-containing protein [Pseudomonas asplenii]|uniref:S-type pyocin domain-containing protein n=1 Tax=Pseudomonas asplenii TaxID=53407 RepID=UPI0037C6FFD3
MNNQITLPPIVVTPDFPLPRPPVLPPTPVAKPLPWNGQVVALSNLDSFFSKKDIKSQYYSVTIVVSIASAQQSVEQSYLAYLPSLRSDIDAEIATAVGTNNLSPLEKAMFEKSAVDSMLKQSNAELVNSHATANAFFGRDPLARDIKNSAVDFTNILQNPRNPNSPLDTYRKWSASITAVYKAKILSEKIRILTEKSNALTTSIANAQAEAIKAANTFRAQGSVATTRPLFVTSTGIITVIEAAAITLQAAIRSAITALTGFAAATASGLLVGVTALVYSPKLANGELPERYTFSTPLSDLDPDLSLALQASPAAGEADLPFRFSSKTAADGRSELFVVKTDGATVPSKVRVVAATYDAAHKVYTATTADVPSRTLTWTPQVSPGDSSTSLPGETPEPAVYAGATITPVEGRIDTFPAVAEAGFNDFITVFPADSGLPPIYVMFRDRREDPGIATGFGQPVGDNWLIAASQNEGAPIPSRIADQLRGKEFKNFRKFREAFWKAVANDQKLAGEFGPGNLAALSKGYSAFVRKADRVGKRIRYELHHKKYISLGGDVYDTDNINVVTPKRHIEIHQENKQ